MRLFVLSDLHLEKRSRCDIRLPSDGFDALVCAGDIWEGHPEGSIDAVVRLAAGRPAVVVPGNHDRYRASGDDGRTAADLLDAMRRAAERHNASADAAPLVLLDGAAAAVIDGVTFIGATLWSDWTLAGLWRPDIDPAGAIADAVAHVTGRGTGSREYRGSILRADGAVWHPHDAMEAHRRDRDALRRALARPSGGPRVVVTHHAPLAEILEPYRGAAGVPWWLPAFYASRALPDLPEESRPDLWVSGHFHARHDLRIGRTRCVANPVAASDFDPGFVVDLAAPSAAAR